MWMHHTKAEISGLSIDMLFVRLDLRKVVNYLLRKIDWDRSRRLAVLALLGATQETRVQFPARENIFLEKFLSNLTFLKKKHTSIVIVRLKNTIEVSLDSIPWPDNANYTKIKGVAMF